MQKHAINALGFGYVMKMSDGPQRERSSPLLSLDYRCHVAGGAIGTAYPPPVTQCLRALSEMSPEQVRCRRLKVTRTRPSSCSLTCVSPRSALGTRKSRV